MIQTQSSPKIVCYLKTYCGWCEQVRKVMRKHELEYEEKDIIKNPAFRWEMEQKSGQKQTPCVLIDGVMLAAVTNDELEEYLTKL